MLTFKDFLSIINEDASVDKMVADIQTAIGNIDTQLNQRTQPLINQKIQLQKRLSPLLKKKAIDDDVAAKKVPPGANPLAQPMQAAPQPATPGSSNNSTPGVAQSTPIR